MSIRSGLIVLVLCYVSLVHSRKLPSYITPCKKSDPEIGKCFTRVVDKQIRPHLKKGIPELGIPPCDPLVIPRLTLKQPDGQNVGFDAVLTNLSMIGGLDFVVKKHSVDFPKNIFYMELNFPHLKMEGHYNAKGRILLVSFEGDGIVTGEFQNVTLYGTFRDIRIKKNGKEYYKIDSKTTIVDVEDINVNFDNLFKNNPAITENTNKLINENRDVLFLEIKPIIERTIADLVTSVVNKVNERYSVDELFPE